MSGIGKDELEEISEGGDLGLGRGLKPGGIPNDDLLEENDRSLGSVKTKARSTSVPLLERKESLVTHSQSVRPKDIFGLSQKRKAERSRSASDGNAKEEFPAYAEVPFGTSLRQHKKLYEQKINELFPAKTKSIKGKDEKDFGTINSQDALVLMLQEKLKEAENDVELLRQDLETCKQQLQSKYLALRALQKQNYAVQSQQIDKTRQAKLINRQLIQELNDVQFQLEYQQSTLMDAQNLWVDRFNRVCDENNALMATLEARSDQMRKMTADKMAVERERDELLALLDVQERQRYETTRSQSNAEEQAYNYFTSSELGVLGACRCRNRDPQPCGCAHAAAYMKREICKLRDELESQKQKADNALVTTDAYRMAFEEQLSRNRILVKQIAELVALPCPQPSKASKAKAAIKWLVKQLNEDESIVSQSGNLADSVKKSRHEKNVSNGHSEPLYPGSENTTPLVNGDENENAPKEQPASACNGLALQIEKLNTMSQPELIDVLTEMISDRSEALAHQRLAAQMLAKRTKELEEKLTAVTEGDDVFSKE